MKNGRPLSDVRCQRANSNVIKFLKLRNFPSQKSSQVWGEFCYFHEGITDASQMDVYVQFETIDVRKTNVSV